MLRRILPLAILVSTFGASLCASDAFAQQPNAAEVRKAAQAFDDGARAFKNKEYEEAASRFEAADSAVPSADSLRLAIKARDKAGQGSRAATLAALAISRYPQDAQTREIADDIIEASAPILHKVSVSCASPCVLAVGTRGIHGVSTTRWVIYLDPGNHEVSASFFGDMGGGRVFVEAEAGGETSVRIEPDESEAEPNVPAPGPKKDPVQPEGPDPVGPDEGGDSGWGLHPAFFVGGLVVTAGLGGVTVWSGLDTQNNPGADAVREGCRGLGEDCELYQDGRSKQTRTNILIGATAGVGALTLLIGTLLTDWGGDDASASNAKARPSVGSWNVGPMVGPSEGGVSAHGRF